MQLGNYVPAVKYGLLAVKTAEDQEDTDKKRGLYYFGLGSTYKAIPNYPLAEKYFRKALAEETKYNNLDGIFQISIYLHWVLTVQKKGREALKVLTDMTRNYPSIEKRDMIQYAGAMLNSYEGLGEYKNAMPYSKILEAAKKTSVEDFGAMDVIYNKLIPFYAVLGNKSKVKQYSKEYYQHLKTVNVPNGWYEYYLMNFYTDSIAGDYFGALKNYKIAIKFRDSMTNQNTLQQINELNVMYETAQKDKDLSALKKESRLKSILISQSNRVRNISMLLAITLMAIALIIFIGYRRKQRTNLLLKRHQDEIDRKNEALQTLVREKEWLVKEIHHRVKNNLHMVVGLLASQTEFLKNEEALSAISDSQNRIQAMSLIHQKLYQMSDMSSINMPVYIQELTDHLKDAFRESTHVLFKLHITDVKFPLTYSVPIGLILNEAITNAMKYAFPDKKGIIEIRLDVQDNNYHLSIKDNGTGLPEGFNDKECNSLGIILMNGLSGDIGGTLHMKNQEPGLLIKVIFPVENTKP
jgi:two-component sensor histidine kinase